MRLDCRTPHYCVVSTVRDKSSERATRKHDSVPGLIILAGFSHKLLNFTAESDLFSSSISPSPMSANKPKYSCTCFAVLP